MAATEQSDNPFEDKPPEPRALSPRSYSASWAFIFFSFVVIVTALIMSAIQLSTVLLAFNGYRQAFWGVWATVALLTAVCQYVSTFARSRWATAALIVLFSGLAMVEIFYLGINFVLVDKPTVAMDFFPILLVLTLVACYAESNWMRTLIQASKNSPHRSGET